MTRTYLADLDLSNQAINNASNTIGGRETLTANRTYYVDSTNGNDSNDGLTIFNPSDVSALPQNGSIESYWKLDETSGTRADVLGVNNLVDTNSVGFQAGINGNEAVFNGTTQRLDNNLFVSPSGDFSVTSWITIDLAGVVDFGIINQFPFSGTLKSWGIFYDAGLDRFQAKWSTDGSTENSVAANNFGAVSAGVRYFVAITYVSSTGTMAISVNASAQDTNSGAASAVFSSSANLTFGAYSGGISFLDGKIDEVCYWDGVALSTGEISTMYNSGSGFFPTAASGTPFLTIQKAVDAASLIEPKEFEIDIQLADGTYDTMSAIALKSHLAQNPIIIKGNNSDRTLVVIDDSNPTTSFTTIQAGTNSPWGFQDLTIGNSSAGAGTHYCINATNSNIELIDCRLLGTGNTQGINLDNNSLSRILFSLQIEGTFGANLFLLNHSFINAESISFDFISSPSVTTNFFGINSSAINLINAINTGSLTGTRYDIRGCTALRTTNGLDTDVAGSIAGTTASNAVIYN